MSELITGVVKFAFGLISNKLRTYGAGKLEDGGLTDQKLRGIIVREFDEIKSKLDAISRKDLCTSVSSLQEGIISLIMCYGESFESGNPSTSKLPSAGACSVDSKPSLSSVTVKDAIVLATVIGKMKIESNDRLESAKESFKEASKEANRAFHNTALTIEERILAAKVRIASRILRHLDDLEFAVGKCLHCLRELNDMQAIQEIFSVDIKGGIKSVFKKDSRKEIVENVAMVNCVLADFISKFTKLRMAVFDWPMIQCGKQYVHPIYYKEERLPNLKEMKIKPPWYFVVTEHTIISRNARINKTGDLICFTEDRRSLQKLDHTTGKLQPYCLSSLDGMTECPQFDKVIDLAVDEDDALYVLSCDEKGGYALYVYSADGKNTHHSTLEFLEEQRFYDIQINVNNEKNIVIGVTTYGYTIMIYLCSINGALISSFDTGLKRYDYFIQLVSVSCNKKIILLTTKTTDFGKDSNELHMYTEDGQLQKTVKFRPSDGNNNYSRLCYNQVNKNIIGCLMDFDKDRVLIEQLSGETGELQHSYLLSETIFPRNSFSSLVCHPSGALALVGDSQFILLKKASQ